MANKAVGRPRKPKFGAMAFRLTYEAIAAIELLATRWRTSKTESVERAVIRAAARFAKPKVEE